MKEDEKQIFHITKEKKGKFSKIVSKKEKWKALGPNEIWKENGRPLKNKLGSDFAASMAIVCRSCCQNLFEA